jgi:hypothetical protein
MPLLCRDKLGTFTSNLQKHFLVIVGLNILFKIDYQFITAISVLKWLNNKIDNSEGPLSILVVLAHFLFKNVCLHVLKLI